MINRGLGLDQSRKIEGDILWWRLWQSLRRWIMMCNLYQHQPVMIWECSQKTPVFWKGNIRSEINGTTMIWLTYRSKSLCSNNSNNQTGNSWAAREAQRCTIRLYLIGLVKLQDLPIFRNHPMPLQICFHREYTELQTKIASGKENSEYLMEASPGHCSWCHSQELEMTEIGREQISLTQFFKSCTYDRLTKGPCGQENSRIYKSPTVNTPGNAQPSLTVCSSLMKRDLWTCSPKSVST